MLRVGDWIEMPSMDADGDVIDIALHTVKVQNFDKTITTIPTLQADCRQLPELARDAAMRAGGGSSAPCRSTRIPSGS